MYASSGEQVNVLFSRPLYPYTPCFCFARGCRGRRSGRYYRCRRPLRSRGSSRHFRLFLLRWHSTVYLNPHTSSSSDDALQQALRASPGPRLQAALETLSADVVAVAPAEVVQRCCDTVTSQGVVALVERPVLPLPPTLRTVLICDGIQDPGTERP